MTMTQRDALDKINAVRNNYARKFYAEIVHTIPDYLKDTKPSEWVSVVTLLSVHHVRSATIRALVKQGILEERPSDGWGPEVRIANPAFVWTLPESE